LLHLPSLDVNPNVDTGDTAQYQEWGMMALGVLIATAIVIFGWRMLNGVGKTIIIVIGLILFIIAFVAPNWGNGG
jgi:hypothetical protein